MEKSYILSEIRRTAEANGGRPLGIQLFADATGIKESDWHGRFWARWGDALKEAGFAPNVLTTALDGGHLLGKLAELVRELGRFPVMAEIKLKRRRDRTFPSHNTFARFGGVGGLKAALVRHCSTLDGFDDVIALCGPLSIDPGAEPDCPSEPAEAVGSVYLMKAGRYFKIGMSNAVGRREYELGIQLPEKPRLVHEIRTDDPPGIEGYWHRRFADRRKGGEWFDLTPADVAAFRRRKFM